MTMEVPSQNGFDALGAAQAVARQYAYFAQRSGRVLTPQTEFCAAFGLEHLETKSGVVEIRDAIVLGGEWVVIDNERLWFDAFVQTPEPPFSAYLMGRGVLDGKTGVVYEAPSGASLSQAYFLGGCPNYAHWLFDYLPRIAYYGGLNLPILVNDPLRGFQREALAILGVDPERLVRLRYPGAYAVERLLYPSLCSGLASTHIARQVDLSPAVTSWLRRAFAPLCRSPRNRRIFISRAGGSPEYRRLLNHEEIADAARTRGFEIVRLEDLPFAEQVGLFSEASLIAGPHGAGFANTVFCPQGSAVIEMMGPSIARFYRPTQCFGGLAAVMGHRHCRLVGARDQTAPTRPDHVITELYTIDPAIFVRSLDTLVR